MQQANITNHVYFVFWGLRNGGEIYRSFLTARLTDTWA